MSWTAVQFVSSGLTLIAFLAAGMLLAYRSRLRHREKLILGASEESRAELVSHVLDSFRLKTGDLSKKDQRELAIHELRARQERFRWTLLAVSALLALSIIAAILSAILPQRTTAHNSHADVPSMEPFGTIPQQSITITIEKFQVVYDEHWMPTVDSLKQLAPDVRKQLEGYLHRRTPPRVPADAPSGPRVEPASRTMFGMRGAAPFAMRGPDGLSVMGIFYKGEWYLDRNGNGVWDEEDGWAKLGQEGTLPIVGDWDGNGEDDIGVAWSATGEELTWLLRFSPFSRQAKEEDRVEPSGPRVVFAILRQRKKTSTPADRVPQLDKWDRFGFSSDLPFAISLRKGIDQLGVFRDGKWYARTYTSDDAATLEIATTFGRRGDFPVPMDTDGDGIDELAVYRDGLWLIDTNKNMEIDADDRQVRLGEVGDVPLVGDWDGNKVDEPGIYLKGEPTAPSDTEGPRSTDDPLASPTEEPFAPPTEEPYAPPTDDLLLPPTDDLLVPDGGSRSV